MLKDTLPLSLLWERDATFLEVKRSLTYRAPSWSWANLDGPLYFYWSRDYFGNHIILSKVLDVWTKPVEGFNHLGQIEDGAITILEPSILLTELKTVPFSRLTKLLKVSWDEPIDQHSGNTTFVVFLAIGCFPKVDIVKGILVTPGRKGDTWLRTGTAAVRIFKDKKTESSEVSSDCQAFLEGKDKKTFTIV
jgi:hypothetical protein